MSEEDGRGPIPHRRIEQWRRSFPWLVQGITCRGVGPTRTGDRDGSGDGGGELAGAGAPESTEWDFGFGGDSTVPEVLRRWEALRTATGADTVVRSPQVHGAVVRSQRASGNGLLLAPPGDGHLTADEGVLLTVMVADCVPVYLVQPDLPAVGLLHAGWRGTAAGMLEAGIEAFRDRFGAEADRLRLHLGPSISREEYEVGPEVLRALGLPERKGPARVDLRRILAERAVRAGADPERITASDVCTRRDPAFYSHRGGDTGRQVAFLGIRRHPEASPRRRDLA